MAAITTRRGFLGALGQGALFAALGPQLMARPVLRALGLPDDGRLHFGELESLAARMQETPPARLQEELVREFRSGTSLRTLVAAGALANARTFGGQDYNGYHAFMALAPAHEMARLGAAGDERRILPVLKVLYRNAQFMQDVGGRSDETLRPVAAPDKTPDANDHVGDHAGDHASGGSLREAMRRGDMAAAEVIFADASRGLSGDAYAALQPVVRDDIDVHRIVLAWRAWDMLAFVGEQHAHTMLRQSLRHCVDREQQRMAGGRTDPGVRDVLPRVLEEYGLIDGAPGTRRPDDQRIEELGDVIFGAEQAEAAAAMAEALSEGWAPEDLGESLSLAGNRLLRHDPGRSSAQAGKPVGSVHGASVGVHASDAACAWRNVTHIVGPADKLANLVTGAFHTGGQSRHVGARPFSTGDAYETLAAHDAGSLLPALDEAVEAGDQARAMAVVQRSRDLGGDPTLLFESLRGASLDADGALHAEKYFSTVVQEFDQARPAFRWRHLVGLARVCASQSGFTAPGLAQARELLSG